MELLDALYRERVVGKVGVVENNCLYLLDPVWRNWFHIPWFRDYHCDRPSKPYAKPESGMNLVL
jgi:hypothetical protein